MTAITRILLLPLVLLYCNAALAGEDNSEPAAQVEAKKTIPEPLHAVSQHRAKIGGSTVAYTAVAGQLLMKDEAGEPIALFGYTAYTKDDADPRQRPVMFAYNGGPGSASMWLHMGILGPQRTVIEDGGFASVGPFQRVNNEYSILDRADLVMIDPVGTGFSEAVGEAKGEDFWGVDQDIESVSNFIARWVTDNGRWQSPKYLLGESYGGIRSGGVAYELLQAHSLTLNGVILVSPYMDFAAGNAGLAMDLPYVNYFSTYAATAWYHKAIDDRPGDLQAFLREAERFAAEEYAPLLFKGASASAAERQRVLAGMERFTGISAEYWDRANLRVDESRFAKELLRERRQTTGRIDSRFVNDGLNHIGEQFTYDPFFPAVGPAFVATFNDYYREELGVDSDRKYITSGGLWKHWDNTHEQPGQTQYAKVPYANTAVDLAYAMVQNPNMRLLVQQGYYDLATPYGATEHFLNHLLIPERLRDNISVEHYEAGHMMYIHPASMERFKADLAAFIDAGAQ
ncbi:S10 family peptidase [Parahaliea mediterranea]|uniref:Carboxypeptidase n=1 Tax=Parahaliea mediterranea TaxID=651086 RepID=A0A939ILZ7_9GAMM|nr:carboxypeptidase [Parahaliea mediterranea]MBN7797025.1 carboxypeptidase [Parahaliea mediterranea]